MAKHDTPVKDEKAVVTDVAEVAVEIAAVEVLPFWDRHRLSLLLVLTVVVAIVMTSISVAIYYTTGAAQLDLSRPGYQSVSDQVEQTDEIKEFSASGAVNKDVINDFTKQYDEQAAKAKAVDAFNGDPLNPEILEFGTPSGE